MHTQGYLREGQLVIADKLFHPFNAQFYEIAFYAFTLCLREEFGQCAVVLVQLLREIIADRCHWSLFLIKNPLDECRLDKVYRLLPPIIKELEADLFQLFAERCQLVGRRTLLKGNLT